MVIYWDSGDCDEESIGDEDEEALDAWRKVLFSGSRPSAEKIGKSDDNTALKFELSSPVNYRQACCDDDGARGLGPDRRVAGRIPSLAGRQASLCADDFFFASSVHSPWTL